MIYLIYAFPKIFKIALIVIVSLVGFNILTLLTLGKPQQKSNHFIIDFVNNGGGVKPILMNVNNIMVILFEGFP